MILFADVAVEVGNSDAKLRIIAVLCKKNFRQHKKLTEVFYKRGSLVWFFHEISGSALLSETFNEFAICLVVRIKLQIFVEIFFCFLHIFLVKIVVAHVVVHNFCVGIVS